MIILGITGSLGMGKTEACKYFLKNNIDIFDCDKEIASFYKKRETIKEIKKKFPNTINNNKVDKSALASIVFRDKAKLKFLERLLYKKLKSKQSFWLRKKIREKKKIIAFEVPLLFEKDNIKKYDTIIVLSCKKNIQIKRVLNRKNWNKDRLEKTLKEQIPDQKKKEMADLIIQTDRGKRHLYQKIIKIISAEKKKKSRKIQTILREF